MVRTRTPSMGKWLAPGPIFSMPEVEVRRAETVRKEIRLETRVGTDSSLSPRSPRTKVNARRSGAHIGALRPRLQFFDPSTELRAARTS